MSENQVLALKDNYWRLRVRRSTINPAYKVCYRYRTPSGFTCLKPNQHSTLTGHQEQKASSCVESELLALTCSPYITGKKHVS